MESFMFKELICMTALSLALASSPEAYSSMKCGVENYTIDNYGNFAGKVNLTKCNLSKFNDEKNLYLTWQSSVSEDLSFALNIASPLLTNVLCDAVRQLILNLCYNNCDCIKYIKSKSDSTIHNKITGNILEKILLSNWTTLFIGLCGPFSVIKGFVGTAVPLIPPLVLGGIRILNDFWYMVSYLRSDDKKLLLKQQSGEDVNENIKYLKKLYERGCCRCLADLLLCVNEADKKSEIERVFKSLILSEKIVELNREFGLKNIVNIVGVSEDIIKDRDILKLYNTGGLTFDQLRSNGISTGRLNRIGINQNNNIIKSTGNNRRILSERNNINIVDNSNHCIININNNESRINSEFRHYTNSAKIRKYNFE